MARHEHEGPYEQGVQVPQGHLPGRSAHDRLLDEVSAILGQAEGPSNVTIEDVDTTGLPTLDPRSVLAPHSPRVTTEPAALSIHTEKPLRAKRNPAPPVSAVERGRRFKRTVDDAELDQKPHTHKLPSTDFSSPPGSPKRRRVIKAKPTKRRSDDSTGDLVASMERKLSLHDIHGDADIPEDAVMSEADSFSSPPPGGLPSGSGVGGMSSDTSSVKQLHRLGKKPLDRRTSKGIYVPTGAPSRRKKSEGGPQAARMRRARKAAAEARGLPTIIAKEAPVLGDSDSSEDPMAI